MVLVANNNVNTDGGEGASSSSSSEAANKRLQHLLRVKNEVNLCVSSAETLLRLPALGLNLAQEDSFLDTLEMKLYPQETKKASKMDASLLKIGTWQRLTRHGEDLVVKFYFSKKKMVYEMLDEGLKRKIEIQWNHIMGMKAVFEESHRATLEVELSEPPSFYIETNTQPMKHTLWTRTSDFTTGQATACRRHYLQFPPDALDKHYERLLASEPRFLNMSRNSFPTLPYDPYFAANFHNMATSSISFGYKPQTNFVQQHHPYASTSTTSPDREIVPIQHNQAYQTPASVMTHSQPLNELNIGANQGNFFGTNGAVWGQKMISYVNSFTDGKGTQGQHSTALTVTPENSYNPVNIGDNRVENAVTNGALWGQQMNPYGDRFTNDNGMQGQYSTAGIVLPENYFNPLNTSAPYYNGGGDQICIPVPPFPSVNDNQFLTYSSYEDGTGVSTTTTQQELIGSMDPHPASVTGIQGSMENNSNYEQILESTPGVTFDPQLIYWF